MNVKRITIELLNPQTSTWVSEAEAQATFFKAPLHDIDPAQPSPTCEARLIIQVDGRAREVARVETPPMSLRLRIEKPMVAEDPPMSSLIRNILVDGESQLPTRPTLWQRLRSFFTRRPPVPRPIPSFVFAPNTLGSGVRYRTLDVGQVFAIEIEFRADSSWTGMFWGRAALGGQRR